MTPTAHGFKRMAGTTLFTLTAALVMGLSFAATTAAQPMTCGGFCDASSKLATAYGDLALNGNGGVENSAFGDNALGGNTGSDNTAVGLFTLIGNTGNGNTTEGVDALMQTNTGSDNTAIGFEAMQSNTNGGQNTAIGANALQANTTGTNNTAAGARALFSNTAGYFNTASGFDALFSNTMGIRNAALGSFALSANTASFNTATGADALASNTRGIDNTATGAEALGLNHTGSSNTAMGFSALLNNTKSNNTAAGANALLNNSTGANNTALGFNAGRNLTTGSNNIDIDNGGVAGESGKIRIGTKGFHTATFIAGIGNTPVNGSDVVVSTATATFGQLGVLPSSARYKRDIHDMGEASSKLMKLRPVSFRYKNDSQGTIQYGLVAEEVARVYPELVTYGDDGKVQTVRYSMLTVMLLNELQKQARQLHTQTGENSRQARQLKALSARMLEMNSKLLSLEQAMQTKNGQTKLAATDAR